MSTYRGSSNVGGIPISVIRDASRSTVIIFAVIAVAGIASGLAYTAMVINSDNSSSAEYGIISILDGSEAATIDDIYSKEVTLSYQDQSSGDIVFVFDIYDLADAAVTDLSTLYFTITLTDSELVSRSASAYLGMADGTDEKSLRILFEPITVTAGANDFDMSIALSDRDLDIDDVFDSKHIRVSAHHLEA